MSLTEQAQQTVELLARFSCPRRNETGFGASVEDCWRDDDTCSYCGSYSPSKLMEHLEAGTVELEGTDKNYKAYLHVEGRAHTKFYFMHLDEPQKRRFVDLYNEKKLRFVAGGKFYVWPFFMVRA